MAEKIHHYAVNVAWTGNLGSGTSGYRDYSRAHEISAPGKDTYIEGSSDPGFRGDPSRWNPEDLLVASLSACHKLWYLGLCAADGIVVLEYDDQAHGEMLEQADGAGQFTGVVLRPRIVLAAGADLEKAQALHKVAHEKCFIARSVNFPVTHDAKISLAPNP